MRDQKSDANKAGALLLNLWGWRCVYVPALPPGHLRLIYRHLFGFEVPTDLVFPMRA